MEPQRRYIEEVGEAVEALGIMLEKELGEIKRGLAELYQSLVQINDQERDLNQEVQKLKEELTANGKLLQRFETVVSRVQSRLIDLQKDITDEEDFTEETKIDLLVIKRELQFVRSDLKEILERQGDRERGLKEEGEKEEGAGEPEPPTATS